MSRCNGVGSSVNPKKHDPRGKVGECPKRIFRLLHRPAVQAVPRGEDPKVFLRRVALLRQLQSPNPGGAARE